MIKPQDDALKIICLTTAAVIVIGGYVIWKQKSKKLRSAHAPIPKKWRQVGEVSKINLYPLKSGRHQILNKAECTEVGLKEEETVGKLSLLDRSFIVYDDVTNDKFTIRGYPKMLFINVKAKDEDSVVFSNPGSEDLVVKIPTSKNEKTNNNFVIMWYQEKIFTVDCGEAASVWLTKILVPEGNKRCRLGYYARDVLPARSLNNGNFSKYSKAYKKIDDDYMGSYSDWASYMIMTQSSLDELNSRLETPVSVFNFRPNILVKGTKKPFEEDEWDWLKIGDNIVLRSFKLCTRCLVTTTNPETGVRHPELEPLKTLKKYRTVTDPERKKVEGQSPAMGILMGLHKSGIIKIGDPVYVNSEE